MTPLFRKMAVQIIGDLHKEEQLSLTVEDCAAIVGNLAHECAGFEVMQEIRPVVSGSKGGYGWAQWTGSRRTEFMEWCGRKGVSPDSYEGNYSFLFRELVTTEKRAIPALTSAAGLEGKVRAFEKTFLRAGVKNYPSRMKYARDALQAWIEREVEVPQIPTVEPAKPKEEPKVNWLGLGVLALVVAAIFIYLIFFRGA